MGNIGGKSRIRVKCPRCKKMGSLRCKQRGSNAIIAYHYDPVKYKAGTKGTKSCYIGSITTPYYKTYEKYFEDSHGDFDDFTNAWNTLKKSIQRNSKIIDIKPSSDALEMFAAILNELRKIRIIEQKDKMVKGQKISWSIRCPGCRSGIQLHAAFYGVSRKKTARLWNTPQTRIYYSKVDTSRAVRAST